MKTIIIGGVAGGATCAARLRRLDEKMSITIIEKTGFISYANCGLPYFLGEVIKDKKELTLQTKESFKARYNVDVLLRHEALNIDRLNKKVLVKNLDTNIEFSLDYDYLVLATGAEAIIPNIKGSELALTLKTVEDTFKIDNYIKEHNVKNAVVVGGGFIGLEVAENLKVRGLDVTLVEKQNQVLAPLDKEMANFVHNNLRRHNIKLLLVKEVVSLTRDFGVTKVNFVDDKIEADLVIFALGVRPNSSLGMKSGLTLGLKNSIKVDSYLRTSDKAIFACGDVIEVKNSVSDMPSLISLAGPANKQARIVASNICGHKVKYEGALGTSIIKLFDKTIAFTGLNEKTLKYLNYNYNKIYLSPNNHASYYPGSETMTLKIMFKKDDYKILGAQIVGSTGVDKRIDILALAISKHISLLDLKDIDFAYAPPYGSAKDPINMASFIADNLATNTLQQVFLEDVLDSLYNPNIFFLDVRTKKEYSRGHIKNFINIPLDTLRENLTKIPNDKKIYCLCQSALRSYIACSLLKGYGYDTYNIAGGYLLYEESFLDKESKNTYDCGLEK